MSERTWTANCSCGITKQGTRDELRDWARTHDDAPWRSHVVSSLAFLDNHARAEEMADQEASETMTPNVPAFDLRGLHG